MRVRQIERDIARETGEKKWLHSNLIRTNIILLWTKLSHEQKKQTLKTCVVIMQNAKKKVWSLFAHPTYGSGWYLADFRVYCYRLTIYEHCGWCGRCATCMCVCLSICSQIGGNFKLSHFKKMCQFAGLFSFILFVCISFV